MKNRVFKFHIIRLFVGSEICKSMERQVVGIMLVVGLAGTVIRGCP
jgi:hypothetical protein